MGDEIENWLDESETKKIGRTYFSSDSFLEDLRKGELMETFLLTEGAFQVLAMGVNTDKNLAQEITDNAIVIVLKADKGMELGGILELAEVVANGR